MASLWPDVLITEHPERLQKAYAWGRLLNEKGFGVTFMINVDCRLDPPQGKLFPIQSRISVDQQIFKYGPESNEIQEENSLVKLSDRVPFAVNYRRRRSRKLVRKTIRKEEKGTQHAILFPQCEAQC